MRNRGSLNITASGDREIVMTRVFDAPRRLVFVEQGGKTTLTATMRYESREARDAVVKSPMEGGVAKSYDKLAELLASPEMRK